MTFMWVAVLILATCALGDRDERRVAQQMDGATKVLVDNLLAELSQARRENSEITMETELLANEVRRLSRIEVSGPKVDELQVAPHSQSLEESKSEKQVVTLNGSLMSETDYGNTCDFDYQNTDGSWNCKGSFSCCGSGCNGYSTSTGTISCYCLCVHNMNRGACVPSCNPSSCQAVGGCR